MAISLGSQLLGPSSGLPGSSSGPDVPAGKNHATIAARSFRSPLFDLAPGGVYLARPVTRPAGELLPHRFTLTPSPISGQCRRDRRRGGLLSVALSLASRPVGVTHHRVLRSPDFPLVKTIHGPIWQPPHLDQRPSDPLRSENNLTLSLRRREGVDLPCQEFRRASSVSMAFRTADLSAHHWGATRYCGGASALRRSTTHSGGNRSIKSTAQSHILVVLQEPHLARANPIGQRRVNASVEVVQFDGVNPQSSEHVGRGPHVLPRLARNAENHMGPQGDSATTGPLGRVFEIRVTMPAVEPSQRPIMNRLNPEFQDHPRPLGQLAEQIEDLVRNAIGPRADRHAADTRMRGGFLVEGCAIARRVRRYSSPVGNRPGIARWGLFAAPGGFLRRSAGESIRRGPTAGLDCSFACCRKRSRRFQRRRPRSGRKSPRQC